MRRPASVAPRRAAAAQIGGSRGTLALCADRYTMESGLYNELNRLLRARQREGLKIFLGITGEVNPISPTIQHANPPLQPDS